MSRDRTPGSRDSCSWTVEAPTRRWTTVRAIVLTIVVLGAVVVGTAGTTQVAKATESATISADPNAAGSTATHTVWTDVESADDNASLRDVDVDYGSASRKADIQNVGTDDVVKVGIDEDGDGTVDTDVSDSLSGITYGSNYHKITFEFDGKYTLSGSDSLVVVYQNVTNPKQPGTYETQIAINHDTTDHPSAADLKIVDETTEIRNVSVDPSTVSPGEKVSHQTVQFTATAVSADGNRDVYYVEFPNTLSGGLSANDAVVKSGSTSVTSGPSLVDGQDGDGTDETLKFATNDGSGGTSNLTLAVDATVEYPADATDGTEFGIDLAVEDSDASDASQTDATTVTVQDTTAPNISSYSLTNPTGTKLKVSFNSDESLTDIEVQISGNASETLTEGDFETSSDGGTTTYTATYDPGATGDYTGSLEVATDAAGNDGASGQTDSVTVADSSSGGSTDDSTSGSAGSSTTTSTATPTDDSTDTSTTETTSVETPSSTTASKASDDSSPPAITAFSLANASEDRVRVSFESNETLADIEVVITGNASTVLTEEDFTLTNDGTYTATYDPDTAGKYEATLRTAADAAGNDGRSAQAELVVLAESASTDEPSTESVDTTPGGSDNTGGFVWIPGAAVVLAAAGVAGVYKRRVLLERLGPVGEQVIARLSEIRTRFNEALERLL